MREGREGGREGERGRGGKGGVRYIGEKKRGGGGEGREGGRERVSLYPVYHQCM